MNSCLSNRCWIIDHQLYTSIHHCSLHIRMVMWPDYSFYYWLKLSTLSSTLPNQITFSIILFLTLIHSAKLLAAPHFIFFWCSCIYWQWLPTWLCFIGFDTLFNISLTLVGILLSRLLELPSLLIQLHPTLHHLAIR